MENAKQNEELQVSSLEDLFGNTDEIGFGNDFFAGNSNVSNGLYGDDPGDMFDDFDGNTEKRYTDILNRKRRLEPIPGVIFTEEENIKLEHVVIEGKSYTDVTPLILETPRSELWRTSINKIR